MRSDKLAGSKFKHICKIFPNMAVLTKSSSPVYIQLTYVHASVGNNYLGKTVTAFPLAGSLKAPTVVLIDTKLTFILNCKKVLLQTTEFLIHTTTGDLAKLKKLCNWT